MGVDKLFIEKYKKNTKKAFSEETFLCFTLLTLLKIGETYIYQRFWLSRVAPKDPTQALLKALLTPYFVLQNSGKITFKALWRKDLNGFLKNRDKNDPAWDANWIKNG